MQSVEYKGNQLVGFQNKNTYFFSPELYPY
ncbi:MAG: hypothetical protein RLZZ628_3284 [Bacteroidota bacterium]|jgi:hypothetical protein